MGRRIGDAWQRVLVVLAVAAFVVVIALPALATAGAAPSSAGEDWAAPPVPDFNDPRIKAQIEAERIRAEQRREWLRSPAAEAQRSATANAYHGLSAGEALALARATFPGPLVSPVQTGLPLRRGDELVGFLNAYQARIRRADGKGAVVSGMWPVRGHRSDGTKAPVNLTLTDSGSSYAPVSAYRSVEIPKTSDDPIRFENGFSVELPSGSPVPGQMAHDRVYYAEIGKDLDAVVRPGPAGASVDFVVRSAASPQSVALKLNLPAGWRLETAAHGAAEIVDGGGTSKVYVDPPHGWDAQKRPLDVSYEVSAADTLVVKFPRTGSVAYPAYVDPFFSAANLASYWSFYSNTGGIWSGSDSNPNHAPYGVWTEGSSSTSYSAGQFGEWYWRAVPGAYIYGFRAYRMSHEGWRSQDFGGILQSSSGATNLNAPESGYWQDYSPYPSNGTPAMRFRGNTRYDFDSSYSPTTTSTGNYAVLGLYMTGGADGSWAPSTGFENGNVSVTENIVPSISSLTHSAYTVTRWVKDMTETINVTATVSGGHGIEHIYLNDQDSHYYGTSSIDATCGTALSQTTPPCPLTLSGSINYDTADGGTPMAEGLNTLTAYARTFTYAAGSAPNGSYPVKIDRSPPDTVMTGSLWSAPNDTLLLGTYNLIVNATDGVQGGTAAQQRSGVDSISIYVDPDGPDGPASFGDPVHVAPNGCTDPDSCPESTSYLLDTADWATDDPTTEITVKVVTPDRTKTISGTSNANTKVDAKTLTIISADHTLEAALNAAVAEAGCVPGQVADPEPSRGGEICKTTGAGVKAVNDAKTATEQEAGCVQGQVADPEPSRGGEVCKAVGTGVKAGGDAKGAAEREAGCVQDRLAGGESHSSAPTCEMAWTLLGSVVDRLVDAVPPRNTSSPSVSGSARDGETLVADRGRWLEDDYPDLERWWHTTRSTYGYQWRRCATADVASCTDVPGATATTYTLTSTDVGKYIGVQVTASNAAGSESADSPTAGPTMAVSPANTGAPSISGTARYGQTLTADKGSWSGSSPISYSHQWRRCTSTDAASCGDIGGATETTYTLVADDIDHYIRVRVTGSNTSGSASAVSTPTGAVQSPPLNDTPPSLSGTFEVDETLTAQNGSWQGTSPISYSYAWRRCTSTDPASCATIPEVTASTYTLTEADLDKYIRVRVTASNAVGSASADSAPGGPVTRIPPANTSLPVISGTARSGQVLTATAGSWSGSPPISYTYQWQRCTSTDVASCSDTEGATATTYTLTDADVERYVRVRVTASNSAGSASAVSATTAVVEGAPVADTPPSVSGALVEGEMVTAAGAWRAAPAASFAYRWLRCPSTDIDGCAEIAVGADATYVLRRADVDKYVRVEVTATNAWGVTSPVSAPAGPIKAARPVNTVLPTISGTLRDGATIAASSGSWDGATPMHFDYQWRRCETADAGSCGDIAGATQSTYVLVSVDVGKRIGVRVTAENGGGEANAESATAGPVTALAPANTVVPAITGDAKEGNLLTATDGLWSGSTPLSFIYQWVRCNVDGADCMDIPEAAGNSYRLQSADVGGRVKVRVTASNAAGSASAASVLSDVVQQVVPSNRFEPTVSGIARAEETLVADPGTWLGSPPISFTYQWQRCPKVGACSDILGASDQEYTLTALDVSYGVRVRVTGTNLVGSGTASSGITSEVAPDAPRHSPQTRELPSITGIARDGQTLTADKGRWVGSEPMVYGYQWQRCADQAATNCAGVDGAVNATYAVTAADVGLWLRVAVTAANPVGSATAFSAVTQRVSAIPPTNTTPPQIVGVPRVGMPLQGAAGRWEGSEPMEHQFQWQRCGGPCVTVATGEGYTVRAEDSGYRIRLRVVTTNAGGATGAVSATTEPVQ